MEKRTCAYLDIETTGLSPVSADLTVVGICLENDQGCEAGLQRRRGEEIIQLVGEEICASKLLQIFKKVKKLFTYNGSRFDLPFIQGKLGIDLEKYCRHTDLMHLCWQKNLYGGFKEVERRLGISRDLTGIDGREAVILWYNYINYGDEKALEMLLKYNQEDVTNLRILRHKLKSSQ